MSTAKRNVQCNFHHTTQMATFAQMFDEILRREITAVLSRVAEGEGLNLDYLVSTYLPMDIKPETQTQTQKPKPKRAAKVVTKPASTDDLVSATVDSKCTATTAKGKQCSLKALSGKCVCRIHDKAPKEPKGKEPKKESKAKKPKKAKKPQPEHTHEVDDEEHGDCELCQSHGTPLDDTDVEEDFEIILSPQKTLKQRLEKISYEEEEEE